MRLAAHFGHWHEVGHRGRKVLRWQVAAALIYGQVKKSYRRRKLVRVTPVMRLLTEAALKGARPRVRLLRSAEHRLYRTGESDRPTCNSRTRSPYLGHFPTGLTTSGPSGVVASVLSLCASSPLTASDHRAATRARWQPSGATLSATNSSYGSRKNEPTMDCGGSPLFSPAAGPMLSLLRALRRGSAKWQRQLSEAESRWEERATG